MQCWTKINELKITKSKIKKMFCFNLIIQSSKQLTVYHRLLLFDIHEGLPNLNGGHSHSVYNTIFWYLKRLVKIISI